MERIFLDTSCWIAAAGAPIGASRRILTFACEGRLRVVTTLQVLQELADNILTLEDIVDHPRMPRAAIEAVKPYLHIVPTPPAASATWRRLVDDEAATILAAASSSSDSFVSLDQRFLSTDLRSAFPVPILRPANYLREFLASAYKADG